MSKLIRKVYGPGGPIERGQKLQEGSLSADYTGIRHRLDPATGDVGPDSPGGGRRRPGRRPRGPRGGNRRIGGDVRTPLSP